MRTKRYIALILIVVSTIGYAGKIKKGFQALDIYNYFAAKKLFEKALKKEKAAAAYGLSLIYLRDDNPFYNLDSAYRYSSLAVDNFSAVKPGKKKKYAALKIDSLHILDQHNKVVDAWFIRAKGQHNVAGYQYFITHNNNSQHTDSAIYFRDFLAFENATGTNTSDGFSIFLKTYPNSEFQSDAQSAYDRLIYQERTATENFIDYLKFIRDFPESPYRADAEDKIYAIYTKTGSLESYKRFVAEYPTNRNVTQAWKKMFNTYLENNYSSGSIQAFLNEFPDYPFKEELKAQLLVAEQELFPVKERNKWGYISSDGENFIRPEFEGAEPFYEGLAIVSLDGKHGFINKTGDLVIDAIFDDAYQMSEGHAVVEIEGKWGMINRSGEFVIQPNYDDLGNLNEGLAYYSSDELYGYFDQKGLVRLKEQYTAAEDFEKGKAIVSKNDYYGLIDVFGTTTIPFKYERMRHYSPGVYAARFDQKWGLLNETGDTILPFKYDFIGKMACNRALVENDGMYNYILPDGTELLTEWLPVYPESRQLAVFTANHARVKIDKGYNLLDTNGRMLFSKHKEDLGDYGQLIAVKKGEKWGYVSPKGAQVVSSKFTLARSFGRNLTMAGGAPLVGLIDRQGNYHIEPYFERLTFLNDSLLIARSRGSYGILTVEGDTLLGFTYLSIEPFEEDLVQLQTREAVYYYRLSNASFLREEEEK